MLEKAKAYNIFIVLGTVLSAFSLGSILIFTDPNSSGAFIHFFFYLSLFLFVLGLFTLVELYMRSKMGETLYITRLTHSLRQAIFLSFLITGSLFLLARGFLFWWVLLSFVLFIIVLEIFLSL